MSKQDMVRVTLQDGTELEMEKIMFIGSGVGVNGEEPKPGQNAASVAGQFNLGELLEFHSQLTEMIHTVGQKMLEEHDPTDLPKTALEKIAEDIVGLTNDPDKLRHLTRVK